MRVLLLSNKTDLLEIMDNQLKSSNLQAELAATSSAEMCMAIIRGCNIEIAACYLAEDTVATLREIGHTSLAVKTLLLLPREKIGRIDEALFDLVDEYLFIPFDQHELTFRLKYLLRKSSRDPAAAELKNINSAKTEQLTMPEGLDEHAHPMQKSEHYHEAPADTEPMGEADALPAGDYGEAQEQPPLAAWSNEITESREIKDLAEDAAEDAVQTAKPLFANGEGTAAAARITAAPAPRKKGSRKLFRLLTVISFALILLLMAVLVFSLVYGRVVDGPPSVASYYFYVIRGESMAPALGAGGMVFVRPVAAAEIAVNDIITYLPAKEVMPTTHRVVAITAEDGRISFTTRGDANKANDPEPVPAENLVGRVVLTVPYLGYLLNFGQTRAGIITLVLIPLMIIITYELKNIVLYFKPKKEAA